MDNKLEILKINEAIKKRKLIRRYIAFVFALFILAAAYNLLILPNNLVTGGVSGIAVIVKKIIDPAVFIAISNVILLILSLIFLGKKKTVGSIIGIILFPIFVKLTESIGTLIVLENQDVLLYVIIAAFLMGTSCGIIIKNGFSTGGSDIVAQILSKTFKISIGKGTIVFDSIVILSGGIILGPFNIMYALVYLYIYSIMVDKVILGIAENKAFYIITEKDQEIKEYILDNLNHGVTILKAKGAYQGGSENVLMCVVPSKDYFRLKEGIKMIDEKAFFVATDAYEVKGGA